MLAEAGAPADSTGIGISRARLKRSYLEAYHIRRRYTVLDLARRTGLLTELLDRLYPEEARV
jgi:glycerol-1-phosphate dehydrogenase [NAD(P)+]